MTEPPPPPRNIPFWPENLLSPTGIKLYGRVIEGLELKFPADAPFEDGPPELGNNNFLRKQILAQGARFARIYAFSYEGHYYDLPTPAVFLVHTEGEQAWVDPPGPENVGDLRQSSEGSGTVTQAGVAAKGWNLLRDIRFWQYDKGDFSMRLDIETGPFQQILLDAMLSSDGQGYSGAEARSRGAEARSRGAEARSRGAEARSRNWRD